MVRRPAAAVATLSLLLRSVLFGFFGFDFLAEFFVFAVFGFAAFGFVFGFVSFQFLFALVVCFGFFGFPFVGGGERDARRGGWGGQNGGVRRGRCREQQQNEEEGEFAHGSFDRSRSERALGTWTLVQDPLQLQQGLLHRQAAAVAP